LGYSPSDSKPSQIPCHDDLRPHAPS
jgi:hypothetical protein